MVERFGIHDGTDGIVERQVFGACERLEAASQAVRGEGARGDQHQTVRGNFREFLPA